jgi:hypothetical protein
MSALFLFFGGAYLVSAHGSSFSFEEIKDGYKIDIGHDEFIAADESVRFDFALYPEDTSTPLPEGEELFTDVWVTITQNKKPYFAGGIDKPVFGATGFTYAFPKEGEFTLSARFQKDGETVTTAEFPLTIIPPLDQKKELPPILLYALFGLAGLLVGFSVSLFIPKK